MHCQRIIRRAREILSIIRHCNHSDLLYRHLPPPPHHHRENLQRSTGQSRFYIPLHLMLTIFAPHLIQRPKSLEVKNCQKKVHWMKMSIVNANQELSFSDGRHCQEMWCESSLRLRVSSLRLNCETQFGRSQSQMARVARLEGHLLNQLNLGPCLELLYLGFRFL